ncbi:hypothetical protein [Dyella amyloliquefaciens]|uniref:hypothetical protein n=1 Tax=Dyella amyloliquefaciens TaxID=1770545 RepID=UPI00102E24B6|nr:hypothetical protein [Dyella amyloliquefaciens]
MRHPIVFGVLALVVLCAAGLVFYFYGLPMLADSSIHCRTDGSGLLGKTLGCSSSFGRFMDILFAAVALLLAGIWTVLKGIDYPLLSARYPIVASVTNDERQ